MGPVRRTFRNYFPDKLFVLGIELRALVAQKRIRRHEYFAFGNVALDAVLGSAGLQSSKERKVNTLLPRLSQLGERERLLGGLSVLRAGWKDAFGRQIPGTPISNEIETARSTARKFVGDEDKDLHFQVTTVFLSLRKRVSGTKRHALRYRKHLASCYGWILPRFWDRSANFSC